MRTESPAPEPDHELLALAGEAVDAGIEWLARAGEEWSEKKFKASGEEVTDADAEVERRISRVLREHAPGIPVVGEESGGENGHGGPLPARCWLLDPIDGTMNFTRGAPLHAVSLALVDSGRPVLGVLHAPALGRRWSTGPDGEPADGPADGPAGEPPRRPSGARELSRAVVGVTGTGPGGSRSGRLLTSLLDRAYRVRMHGCMSLDLAGVAEGWLDACVCVGPKPWDVAAAVALLRRRGLTVLGADGRPFAFGSPFLAAGRESLARELTGLWRSHAPGPDGGGPGT